MEVNHMEESQVIKTLSNSILDLLSRLEVVEKDEDVRLNVHMEGREAYF